MSHLHLGTAANGAGAKGLGGSAAGPATSILGQSFALPGFTLSSGTDWLRGEDQARFNLTAGSFSVLNALDGISLFQGSGSSSGAFGGFSAGGTGLVLDDASASAGSLRFALAVPDPEILAELRLDAASMSNGQAVELSGFGAVNLRLGDAAPGGALVLGGDPLTTDVNATVLESSAIYIDARGLGALGGLSAELGMAGGGGGSALVYGSVVGDHVSFSASESGDLLLGSLGGGDDVWVGAGQGTERVVGGSGGDRLEAAGGDDLLFGDQGLGEPANLVRTVTGEGAAELLSTGAASSARVELGFVGSEAGYRNLVGWYTVDADGSVRTGRAVWDEDRAGALAGGSGGLVTAANLAFDMTPEEASNLNFFCVPDGLNMAGVTGLQEGAGSDGILRTNGLTGRTAGIAIEVRVGAFGQGQVWIDLDGNGSAETLLQGRMSNQISSVDMNGAAAGGFLDNNNADGTGDNFSGFFSETGLNPHTGDYTANVGSAGRQFVNTGAGAYNPTGIATKDTTWGQIGFEDLYGGVNGNKYDRDYDDSVVQVKVSAILGSGTGNDTLVGGFGSDRLYGDGDAAAALATGGADTLIGDAGGALAAIGGSNREADWVSPILALIQASGSWSGVVVPGETGDWAKLAAPQDWAVPGVSGIGLRSGPGFNGETPTNPEINPGPADQLTFLLTQGATQVEVDLAVFFGREGERGEVDLLDEGGAILTTLAFTAAGSVSWDGGPFLGVLLGGGDSYDGVNPGRSTLVIETLGSELIHGLSFRAVDQNANPTDNPSDYLIEGLRVGLQEGDDLLVGGLGADRMQADGDLGASSFGSSAVVRLGYDGSASSSAETVLADWLTDGAAYGIALRASLDEGATWQTVDGMGDLGAGSSWFTSAADPDVYTNDFPIDAVGLGVADPAAPVRNTRPQPGNAEVNDSPGALGDVIEVSFGVELDSVTVDFALLYAREGQSWPDGPGEQVHLQLIGSAGQVLGEVSPARSEVPSGAFGPTNPGFGRVTFDAARLETVAGGQAVYGLRMVGLDDSPTFEGNANDGLLRGLSVGFRTVEALGGDTLDLSNQAGSYAVDASADQIVWNHGLVAGSRGDGLDVVYGFDPGRDVLRFGELGVQSLRSVLFEGRASTLVTDSLAAEGTGVILAGIERADLTLGVDVL